MMTEEGKAAAKATYRRALQTLNASHEPDKTPPWFDLLWEAGQQPRRFFHNSEHFLDVGAFAALSDVTASEMDRNDALAFLAGLAHDVVYHQVDKKAESSYPAFRQQVEQALSPFLTVKDWENNDLTVTFTPQDRDHEMILDAARTIFKHYNDSGAELKCFNGQNEFLSALVFAEMGHQLGMPMPDIVAGMGMIEATIPFGAPDRLMHLKARLQDANGQLPSHHQLRDEEINHLMPYIANLANRDVGNFADPLSGFIHNSFMLLLENSTGEVCTPENMDADTINPVLMTTAMNGMASYMKRVTEASRTQQKYVFHRPDGTQDEREITAQQNIDQLCEYLLRASSNLQVLINDYKDAHGSEPKRWGDIRMHAAASYFNQDRATYIKEQMQELPKQNAAAFFRILGADLLGEIQADLPSGDPSAMKHYLMQLKMRAAIMRAETLGNEDFAPGFAPQKKTGERDSQLRNGNSLGALTGQPDPTISTEESEYYKAIVGDLQHELVGGY